MENKTAKHHDENFFWLNDLRYLAAIAIIFVHVAQPFYSGAVIGSDRWWVANAFMVAFMWGVPVFVMISGALLLTPHRTYPSVWEFYRRRLKRLFWPVAFWSGVYLFLTYLKNKSLGEPTDTLYFLQKLIQGQPYYHMWYLYMVWGLYLVAPFLRPIAKEFGKKESLFLVFVLFALAIVAAQATSPQNQIFFLLMFPFYLSYFFAGHLIAHFRWDISLKSILLALLLLSAIMFSGQYFSNGSLIHNFSPTMVLFAIFFVLLLKRFQHRNPISKKLRKTLASFSLGAYLIHPAVLAVYRKSGIIEKTNDYLPLAATIVLTVVQVVIVSLIIAFLFSKTPFLKKTI